MTSHPSVSWSWDKICSFDNHRNQSEWITKCWDLLTDFWFRENAWIDLFGIFSWKQEINWKPLWFSKTGQILVDGEALDRRRTDFVPTSQILRLCLPVNMALQAICFQSFDFAILPSRNEWPVW
jgi:hypothetical protein